MNWILRALLGAAGPLLLLVLGQLRDKKIFEKLLDLAQAEVARLDGETMDELEKRKLAYLRLRESAVSAGLLVRDSMIDFALAFALAAMRAGVR